MKPSNVLINKEGHVKMCDFGISGYLVDSVAKTMDAGCKPYMAVSQGIPQGGEQKKILPLCSGLDFSSCTSSLRDSATIYLYSMIPVWMTLSSLLLGTRGSLRLGPGGKAGVDSGSCWPISCRQENLMVSCFGVEEKRSN